MSGALNIALVPNPIVTVVIPTFDRPQFVKRAVLSALGQSLKEIEVIVVIDRPDSEATGLVLSTIADSRLRVIVHRKNMGTNAARNTGISEARGKWIALLDDDDEWFPDKLEVQLQAAESSAHKYPVVACQLVYRTPGADFILPRRLPYKREHISDYMFSRRGLPHTEALLQTSVIFAPRDLFVLVPFDQDVRLHTDSDWLLRTLLLGGTGLEVVQETLAAWNADEGRPRVSLELDDDWRRSYDWVLERKGLFSPRAYAAFIMSSVAAGASKTREPRVFWLLFREAVIKGRPAFIDYLIFLYIWFIPHTLRRKIRDFLLSKPSTVKLWGGPAKAIKKSSKKGASHKIPATSFRT